MIEQWCEPEEGRESEEIFNHYNYIIDALEELIAIQKKHIHERGYVQMLHRDVSHMLSGLKNIAECVSASGENQEDVDFDPL
jgi:hypothetical protein